MSKVQQLVNKMDPEEAASEIAVIMKKLFPLLGEEARLEFVMNVIGDAREDKVGGLVHLWLAECMDEGVDPKDMCQSLMNKVAQSEQLKAVTDPEILVLFENWLEELESEVVSRVNKSGSVDPIDLAEEIGLSLSGANFLITKLKREDKL